MKKMFIHILSLFTALLLFGGSVVFAISNINVVEQTPLPYNDDDMLINPDDNIVDLPLWMNNSHFQNSSKEMSSQNSSDDTSTFNNSSGDISTSKSSNGDISTSKNSSGDISTSKNSNGDISTSKNSNGDISTSKNSSGDTSTSKNSSGDISTSVPASSINSVPSSNIISSQISSEVSSMPSSQISSQTPSQISSEISSQQPSSQLSSEISSQDNIYVDESLVEAIAGTVQREIVGVNTVPVPKYYEAYKAQAVAAHSYMEYYRLQTGSYPQMSYCTPDPIIKDLVRQVCNQLIYYNGNVINASYHAASGGYTQSAEYVWSASIGYLKAVESKYDNHNDSFSISSSQLKANLFNAGIYVNGDPSTWIDLKNATFTDGNFIDYITICGQTIRGRTLRERVLGSKNLKSCKIVDVTYSNDTFTFYTNGFGHGVGLSQLGALGYSEYDGWNYIQILTHYYSGIEIR